MLVDGGYASTYNIAVCPSALPRKYNPAARAQIYGGLTWGQTKLDKYPDRQKEYDGGNWTMSNTIMFCDTLDDRPGYKRQQYDGGFATGDDVIIHLRHTGRANVVFMEGYVASMNKSDFGIAPYTSGSWLFQPAYIRP